MKAKDYSQILKARGYRVAGSVNKYEGVDVYIKSHLYNAVVCEVKKDTHGKAQEMNFTFIGGMKTPAKDIQTFKEVEGDREYLVKEAIKIHEAFEQLKQMKAPKHIYCF